MKLQTRMMPANYETGQKKKKDSHRSDDRRAAPPRSKRHRFQRVMSIRRCSPAVAYLMQSHPNYAEIVISVPAPSPQLYLPAFRFTVLCLFFFSLSFRPPLTNPSHIQPWPQLHVACGSPGHPFSPPLSAIPSFPRRGSPPPGLSQSLLSVSGAPPLGCPDAGTLNT